MGGVGVGDIGAGDFLRLGPSVDRLGEKYLSFIIFFLIGVTSSHGAAFNKYACSNDALRERGY